jgi:Leucine-rich repeat (LRR) protein
MYFYYDNKALFIIYKKLHIIPCLYGSKYLRILYLFLNDNKIQKIKNLNNLINLIKIDLGNNQIKKIENLDNLINLQELNLLGNQIKKIENLNNLTNLRTLDLLCNQINLIENLNNLINLQELHLSKNQITKIENLNNLINLQILYLFDNQLLKIENLNNLINLRILNLSDNQIQKIENLNNLINLRILNLSDNQIKKIENLNNLTNLQELHLNNNQIKKIENLNNLTNLQELRLNRNQITKIENLNNLTNLHKLHLKNNQILELSLLLLELQNLNEFEYTSNPIEYIPLPVQRWLNRINRNIKNNNLIYGDTQNVHSSSIQSSFRNSLSNIIQDKVTINIDYLKNIIINNDILTEKTKTELFNYIDDETEHSIYLIKYSDLLLYIWQRIIKHENKDDLLKILNSEIIDSECMCFTGRLTRLLNVLVGYYEDISIQISDSEQITNIIITLKNKYNGEELINRAREELTNYNYSNEIINEWLSYI